MQPKVFLQLIGPAATIANRLTAIPASVTMAQAIDESGWGRAAVGNNLFGIKADASWNGPVVETPTREWVKASKRYVVVQAKWRKYNSWQESLTDHAKFFYDNSRYAPALAVRDNAKEFAQQIWKCGYATDPTYPQKLIALMDEFNLYQYDVTPEQYVLLDWAKQA